MGTTFTPYSTKDSLGSDRTSGDRQRHREKVRESIRENIADVVAEQSIIGRSGDTIVKVPIRGIKEYRFVYGENSPQAGQGDGETQPGQVVGRARQRGQEAGGPGDQPGVDYYETEVTIDEIVEMMFEDLELPDMERRSLRETIVPHGTKRRGYRRQGIRVHLDKKRTMKSRIARKVASPRGRTAERFPFHQDDLRYRRRVPDIEYQSNAVVVCIMDTSGSMDAMKKYLARSFFFLLYQFVRTRYAQVEIAFVAHDSRAREVTEEEFFSKGESGGTMISSGYAKALEIIQNRFHPSLWNVYAFHCSDGDNFGFDNDDALRLARELCDQCNLFGYGEIKPQGSRWHEDSMLELFETVRHDNFQGVLIQGKEDVWPSFKSFLSKERKKAEA